MMEFAQSLSAGSSIVSNQVGFLRRIKSIRQLFEFCDEDLGHRLDLFDRYVSFAQQTCGGVLVVI
jgi:hypothetical protein